MTLTAQNQNTQTLIPLTERVNVQADSAHVKQIIDDCWVVVGTNKAHAIQRDCSCLFNGKSFYRFELKTKDNTLEGYAAGEIKGRVEFSYCYATVEDFKGTCPQGTSCNYEFLVYILSSLDANVSTIFKKNTGHEKVAKLDSSCQLQFGRLL